MAALYASGISNAAITVDSAELPILDGSAAEFIKLLKPLKTKKHSHFLVVRKPVVAKASELKIPLWMRLLNFIKGVNRDGYVRLLPLTGGAPRIEIAARLIYPNSLDIIGDESHEFVFDYNDFEKSAEKFSKEIAPARTFGTLHEWEWLKKHGMGRGANAGNVIALGSIRDVEKVCSLGFEIDPKLIRSLRVKDQRKIIALNGLKFLNEFVRHKIVDAVGDLYTSGYGIIGRFESFKGSHALNNLLLRRLFSDSANYELLLGE
jgi:UDP-3-O-[3-hydroxymyristoyl] N-acetylglucosamine deacetylase